MKKIVEKWCSTSLIMRIAAGLVIGALLGLLVPQAAWLGILGSVFVGALKSIAPVLVFLLVASALSRAHSHIGARFRSVIILYSCYCISVCQLPVPGADHIHHPGYCHST